MGILLHEGTGANTYTIVILMQITIDSGTTGDFIEVKYMAIHGIPMRMYVIKDGMY